MRREQRDKLAARRSMDVGGGAVGGGGAQNSPFSLYSDPLAALVAPTPDAAGAV